MNLPFVTGSSVVLAGIFNISIVSYDIKGYLFVVVQIFGSIASGVIIQIVMEENLRKNKKGILWAGNRWLNSFRKITTKVS